MDLTEEQWAVIEPLIPEEEHVPGRPALAKFSGCSEWHPLDP